MLELKQLTFMRERKVLLRNITFSLKSGDLLLVTGANGSGKSTLVKLLVGILPWQTGRFLWRSHLFSPRHPDYLREVIYLGHQLGLKLKLTALENLRAWLDLRNAKIRVEDLKLALAELGLKKNQAMVQPVEQLSQGQKCRAALARLRVAPRSLLWILDEPFAGLDPSGLSQVKDLCLQHLAVGGIIIMTCHAASPIPNPAISYFADEKISKHYLHLDPLVEDCHV